MAKALRKDRKGALNLYTVLEFPASAHITHKWWQHLYIKKHYYEEKKNTPKTITTGSLGKQFN